MQALIVSPKFILSPCLSGKKNAPFNKEETRSISSTILPHEDSSTLDAAGANNLFFFLYQMRQLLKALQDLSSDIIQFTTNDNPALEASPCQNA